MGMDGNIVVTYAMKHGSQFPSRDQSIYLCSF